MKVGFLGIGVQKGASTWVYKVLEDHPEIEVSFPKELNFFSDEENFKKGLEWYHSFFKKKNAIHTLYGEVSPSYFHDETSPQRAFNYSKNLKIVVTLRDPIDRIYSNYLHLLRRNVIECQGEDKTFEAVLAKSTKLSGGCPPLIDQSYYYKHLKKWFDVFPKENILVLIKEDIEKNPALNAKKLYKFLGINEAHISVSLYRRPNSSNLVKSNLFEFQLRKLSQLAINFGMGRWVQYVKNQPFVLKLREGDKTHLADVVPRMLPETEEKLISELSADLALLVKLLEVESLPWKSWKHILTKELSE